MTTPLLKTTICAFALATAVIGCARTPAVTSMAPARVAEPVPAPVPAAEPAVAPPSEAGGVVSEPREEVAAAVRPQPSAFAPDGNVQPIHFDFDRYEIRPGDARTLEADATWLKTNDTLILIEGQCDERGTVEYNVALGDRRAEATRNYLIAQGIAASRISTVSYGKERPVCTEHTEACWAANRRANLVVKPRA
jgi:peptidoglycan-associated lipoprotein